jgi:hypothetical protein
MYRVGKSSPYREENTLISIKQKNPRIALLSNSWKDMLNKSFAARRKHEEAHTYQYQRYGIFMIALLLLSAIANGGLRTSSFHDFMEKSDFETAADDYAQFGGSPIQCHAG